MSFYRNAFYWFCLLLVVSILGFWRTYFSQFGQGTVHITHHAHGISMLLLVWVLPGDRVRSPLHLGDRTPQARSASRTVYGSYEPRLYCAWPLSRSEQLRSSPDGMGSDLLSGDVGPAANRDVAALPRLAGREVPAPLPRLQRDVGGEPTGVAPHTSMEHVAELGGVVGGSWGLRVGGRRRLAFPDNQRNWADRQGLRGNALIVVQNWFEELKRLMSRIRPADGGGVTTGRHTPHARGARRPPSTVSCEKSRWRPVRGFSKLSTNSKAPSRSSNTATSAGAPTLSVPRSPRKG